MSRMNDKKGNERLYAPHKQKGKKAPSQARSTRFAMPLDDGRVYSPANKKKAREEQSKPREAEKPRVNKQKNGPRFVTEKPVRASTRFVVMPMDQKVAYRTGNKPNLAEPAPKPKPVKKAAKPEKKAAPVQRKAPVTNFVRNEPEIAPKPVKKAPKPRHSATPVKKPQTSAPAQKTRRSEPPVKKAPVTNFVKQETEIKQKRPVQQTERPRKPHPVPPAPVPKRENAKKPRPVPQKTPESVEQARERKQRRRYVVSLTLACMGALACALILTAFVFSIRKITVIGALRYDEDYIRQLADVNRGEILLIKDTDAMAARLNADPYLEAEIQKKYPNEIVIIVSEKTERAYIESVDGWAVIDGYGTVLGIIPESQADASLLKVTGMSAAGLKVGVCLGDVHDYQAKLLLTLIEEIDKAYLTDSIVEINMTNPFGIYIKTNEGIDIYLGEGKDLARKLESIEPCCEKIRSLGYGVGMLDLSNVDNPTYKKYGEPLKTPEPMPVPTDDAGTGTPVTTEPVTTQAPKTEAPSVTQPPETDPPEDTDAPLTSDAPETGEPSSEEPKAETDGPED